MGYDYNKMLSESNELVKNYRFFDMFSIGESVMDKKIICLKVGRGDKKMFCRLLDGNSLVVFLNQGNCVPDYLVIFLRFVLFFIDNHPDNFFDMLF